MLLKLCRFAVTTDAVEWIEIELTVKDEREIGVTTDAVEWIEIKNNKVLYNTIKSPLMQWSGLKSAIPHHFSMSRHVTTDAVVWIEILIVDNLNHLPSRPPLIQ